MTNPHMYRAVQVGAASIDYWLCENDKAIELSSEIREMFREGLEAALPHLRAMIAQEILAHAERVFDGRPDSNLFVTELVAKGAYEIAAQIALGDTK